MNENFMKEKPVFPLIVSMAMPMVISMLVNSLYNIVDSFFVAQISEDAMTALSLVYPVQNYINAVAIGFGVGINAVISYYLGAKEKETANIAATHGTVLSAVHGVVIMVCSIAIMPSFLHMFTNSDTVIQMGLRYSNIAFSFSLVIMLALSFEKLFQSVGRMKVTMEGLLIGCVTNIILDPMFIFGIGFFPELGIAGAALATGIGQVSTLLFYLFVYQRSKMPVCISCKYLVRNAKIDQKLYAIGIPAMLNLALPSLLVSCLNAMLAGYSYSYVVILGIYYKLQTFIYLPTNGIVQGMRPVIGYNYGAGEHQRVKKIYQVTLFMSGCIMVIGTVICLTASKPLIGLFTGNPTTIESGKTALRIISAGFFLSAVSVTSSGALEGLGKGVESLVISLCRCVIIMIPMAYLFSRIWGPIGIWNAFWVTEAVTAGVSIFIYKKSVESGKEKKRYANISTGCVQNRDNSDIINVKNS